MVKIFIEELHWKGKLLVFIWHFKEELDSLNRPLEFVLEILEKGEHFLVSKTQNKYNVLHRFQKSTKMIQICLPNRSKLRGMRQICRFATIIFEITNWDRNKLRGMYPVCNHSFAFPMWSTKTSY